MAVFEEGAGLRLTERPPFRIGGGLWAGLSLGPGGDRASRPPPPARHHRPARRRGQLACLAGRGWAAPYPPSGHTPRPPASSTSTGAPWSWPSCPPPRPPAPGIELEALELIDVATTALRIEVACRPARIGDATAHRGTSGASMVGSSATSSGDRAGHPGADRRGFRLSTVSTALARGR